MILSEQLIASIPPVVQETPVSISWRCSHCGAEGSITKDLNPEVTLRRMEVHHGRLSKECTARFIVVDEGKVMVVSF